MSATDEEKGMDKVLGNIFLTEVKDNFVRGWRRTSE